MDNEKRRELEMQVEAFDKWFQYAEVIGQQRLYNFLMASSIIFVGCATLLASNSNMIGFILSACLAILGAFLSWVWYVLGRRQAKFHDMIDENIDQLCHCIGPDNAVRFPIWHVRDLKLPNNRLSKIQLSKSERNMSNRKVLSDVPKYVGFTFLAAFIFSLLKVYGL